MAEALLWNRFARLPLSEDEKGRIYAELQDADLHQLQKLLPDFLGDEAVASSLRERYLKPRPPEGEETLLDKLLEGQRALAKGQIVLAKEIKNLGWGVSASVLLTLWGDIVSTATSETIENFRKALVNFYGDDREEKCCETAS